MKSTIDGWVAIGLSDAISPGTVAPAVVGGIEIVVWREHSGAAHVWPDRCPHRGMRLSFGFVRDDRLACMYHGWQYAGSGHCAHIPAQPEFEPSAKICVDDYPCREAHGLIWTTLNGADAEALPELSAEGGALIPIRTLHVMVGAHTLCEQLDHAAFPPFARCAGTHARPGPRRGDVATWHATGQDLGSAEYRHEHLDDRSCVIQARTDAGDEKLIFVVQPVSDRHSALHVLTAGDPGANRQAELRSHYHRWLQRLRWVSENTGVPTVDTWSPYHD